MSTTRRQAAACPSKNHRQNIVSVSEGDTAGREVIEGETADGEKVTIIRSSDGTSTTHSTSIIHSVMHEGEEGELATLMEGNEDEEEEEGKVIVVK